MKRWVPLGLLLVALVRPAGAAFPDGFNHPEVKWLEFETVHFVLVYNVGLERTAHAAAEILESVHPEVCATLGVVPEEKTTVILADYDDVGTNNFAQRMQHVIYLSNPVMNQARVERHDWLRHLLHHEYTHVVNGWALNRAGGAAGMDTEWAGMELQPQWFTEGLAEYEASDHSKAPVGYAVQAAQQHELLNGAKLDIAAARFNVVDTATVYKQGQAMCALLAMRCGEDIFAKILKQYGRTPEFDVAFRIATGVSVEAFTKECIATLKGQAAKLPASEPMNAQSTLVPTGVEAALGARMSPDKQWLAVYGIKDWEEPIPKLWIYRADGKGRKEIAQDLDLYASWKFSWSPDSSKLIYVGLSRGKRGAVRNALFVYDLKQDRTFKLPTGDMRVAEPEFSPDGKRLAFGTYRDEHAIIATMATDATDVRLLTEHLPQDCFSPTWSPDGTKLAMSVAEESGVHLAILNADGSDFHRVTNDVWPDQYPAWSPDGRTLAFVSYRKATEGRSAAVAGEAQGLSGAATNLYTVPIEGGAPTQLTTAVSGGVFYPSWTADSAKIFVSLFKVRLADIRLVPASNRIAAAPDGAAVASSTTVATSGPAMAPPVADTPSLKPPARSALASTAPAVVSAVPSTVLPTALGAPATQPAAATSAGEKLGPQGITTTPAIGYRSGPRTKLYVVRPTNDNDGLGTTWGARAQITDPLQVHTVTLQGSYGYYSKRGEYEAIYNNDASDAHVSFEFFRKVPPLRGQSNALVAEVSQGFEALAQLPVAWTDNAYAKDVLQWGVEAADHIPFATSGGVLKPPPVAAWIVGPSIGFKRVEILPGTGSHQLEGKATVAVHGMGSDLGFANVTASYVGQYWFPDPRHTLNLTVYGNWFDGEDFTRTQSTQLLGIAQLNYAWRMWDQLDARHTWPYVDIGPCTFNAGYQPRTVLSGSPQGVDARSQLQIYFDNTGWLSRLFTYELKAGNLTYIGGNNRSDWWVQVILHFRNLPF
jgi:hypothetical protein